MKSKSNFNPLEWSKQENAPQKSKQVNNHINHTSMADYTQAREVVNRIIQAGIDLTDD